MKMLLQNESMAYLNQNLSAVLTIVLMMPPATYPGALPFIITADGMRASTGRFLMMYTGKKDHK